MNMLSSLKRLAPYFILILIIFSGCTTSLTGEQNRALTEILDILGTTITDAENIIKNNTDPTNQYVDILDRLLFMKGLIEEVQKGNKAYDEERISKYKTKIKEIEANIKNAVDEVFSSDIFFGLGKYKISDFSEQGKKALNDFTQTIVDTQVKNFRKLFPGKSFVIVIKTIGYADETPLGPELTEFLTKEIGRPLPLNPKQREKILNTRLSFLRARSIFEYIKMQFINMDDMNDIIIGNPEIRGFGEELPYPYNLVEPPYQPQDNRRRICKVYSKININSQ